MAVKATTKVTLPVRYRMRAKTEAQWLASDEVLLDKEIGYVSDKNYIYKLGDGVSKWSQLKYGCTNVSITDPIYLQSVEVDLTSSTNLAGISIKDSTVDISAKDSTKTKETKVVIDGDGFMIQTSDSNRVDGSLEKIIFGYDVVTDEGAIVLYNIAATNTRITQAANNIYTIAGSQIVLSIIGSNNSIILNKDGVFINGQMYLNGQAVTISSS